MSASRPSAMKLLAIFAFIASCLGLLAFLWINFGGPIPLKPKGYRVHTVFGQATRLATESDVRIAGVPVGKVKEIKEDPSSGKAQVELEIQSRFAPIPADSQAILRQKTLLGETYVELTPGKKDSPTIASGSTLASTQVKPTVELDEILRALDKPTRDALQTWIQQQTLALEGRGKDLNASIGEMSALAEESGPLLETLRRQDKALKHLVKNTGEVFAAISERDKQLRGLVENSNRVFRATGRRDASLRQALQHLPRFQEEVRLTFNRLAKFSEQTDPLVNQLRPAARELSSVLADVQATSADFKLLMRGLGQLMDASKEGFPAAAKVLAQSRPFIAQLDPALRQVIPMFDFIGMYKREITAFFANTVAATQAYDIDASKKPKHYLRTANPLNPENLAAYPRRVGSNRSNPYPEPNAFDRLKEGMSVFDDRNCGRDAPLRVFDSPDGLLGVDLLERVKRYAFAPGAGGKVAAPTCRKQGPHQGNNDRTHFPQVRPSEGVPPTPPTRTRAKR